MKTKQYILTMFLILISIHAISQNDTVIIESTTEEITLSEYKKKKRYNYLDQNQRKEKTLIKLGCSPLYFMYADMPDNFQFNFGIEKRIGKAFSLGAYYQNLSDDFNFTENSFNLEFKYYYKMKKKIEEDIASNNFHGEYLFLKVDRIASYSRLPNYYSNYALYDTQMEWKSNPIIKVGLGLQWRLGKYGYFDVASYLKFNHERIGVGVNIVIGLGLGLKK